MIIDQWVETTIKNYKIYDDMWLLDNRGDCELVIVENRVIVSRTKLDDSDDIVATIIKYQLTPSEDIFKGCITFRTSKSTALIQALKLVVEANQNDDESGIIDKGNEDSTSDILYKRTWSGQAQPVLNEEEKRVIVEKGKSLFNNIIQDAIKEHGHNPLLMSILSPKPLIEGEIKMSNDKIYHDYYSCNYCGGENTIKATDTINSQVCECDTTCIEKDCGKEDSWAYGFYESSQHIESKCKKY